jgi:hypothetical protein
VTGFGIPVKRFTDALPKTSSHLRAVSLSSHVGPLPWLGMVSVKTLPLSHIMYGRNDKDF